MTNIITDMDIQALVDNELDQERARLLRVYVQENEWAKRRYEELKNQKELLQDWWQEHVQ